MAASLAARLRETALRQPDAVALVSGEQSLTYAELEQQVSRQAAALHCAGVQVGERVAITIPGGVAFAVGLLATLRIGGTPVPVDAQLKDGERRDLLDDLGPRLVLDALTPSSDQVDTIVESDAPGLILYTSGSTGRPKGAVLSQSALDWAIHSWAGPLLGYRPTDSVLQVLPLAHSYGLCAGLLAPLLAGARVLMLDRFSPGSVLDTLTREQVTVFPGVATMFRRLLGLPELGTLSALRLTVSGAAPCPSDLVDEWQARTGLRILLGYGMTELFRPISFRWDDPDDEPGTIGHPAPDVEISIVDDDERRVVDGELGELLIRTPGALDGYLHDPVETAAVLRDGWFRTGDLAQRTPSGNVRIAGRKRDRILRGGYSVFPAEVEAVLARHPAVAEAAIIGQADPELGEEVIAFAALHQAGSITPETLLDYCREHLAPFKCPRRAYIVPLLPRSATGKLLRAELPSLIHF